MKAPTKLKALAYKNSEGVNIAEELKTLLARPVEAYISRLKRAIHELIIKDIRTNLKNHIPACYQSQVCRNSLSRLTVSA